MREVEWGLDDFVHWMGQKGEVEGVGMMNMLYCYTAEEDSDRRVDWDFEAANF